MKEFISSLLYITSWLIFVLSGYLLFWVIVMPGIAFIPFGLTFISGLLCRFLSTKLIKK